jgi:hypothetical protein
LLGVLSGARQGHIRRTWAASPCLERALVDLIAVRHEEQYGFKPEEGVRFTSGQVIMEASPAYRKFVSDVMKALALELLSIAQHDGVCVV